MGSCSSKNVDNSIAITEKVLELVQQLIDEGDTERAKNIMKLNNINKKTQKEVLKKNRN